MEDLKSLKRTRASQKSKLTIFKSYLEPLLACKDLNALQIHETNIRLAKIQALYDEFDSIQTQIENALEIPGDEFAERETFERAYFGAIAAAQELLSRHATVGPASGADFASVPGSEVAKLQKRSKWRRDGGQPQIGEMVLIKDDRLPPNRWLLGRVTAVFPGADGVNRVADVYTSSGTMRRAYNRLCPLPTLEPDVPRAAVC
ncbi:uncharacterized protein LOC114356944 isoform X2 [Ostrinia furnacalis]|uniref:uncharacterized protein LOC114356944 isoform X2 n=1 Tax=Ostrinia furnacalis TaxID=93504 RepID=UPI00103EA153|nr:uncharacterized protein LOC114356944 isoform X2 [Ostrinia furnacalis]